MHLIRLLSLLLIAVFTASASPTDTAKVNTLISEGDNFAEKTFENSKALKKYEEALAQAPADYDVLWRMSRAYVDIGEHLPSKTDADKEEQLKYYEKARDYADKAIQSNANGSMGYVRRAIANGRVALFKGVFSVGGVVSSVKEDCEKALQLDPSNATAHYVLARTHLKVCEKPKFVRWPIGLGWGNMEESILHFEKAIALRPDFIMYRLDAARAYAEEDEFVKAKEQLAKIATLAKEDEDDDQFRKEAAELLEKIKDE